MPGPRFFGFFSPFSPSASPSAPSSSPALSNSVVAGESRGVSRGVLVPERSPLLFFLRGLTSYPFVSSSTGAAGSIGYGRSDAGRESCVLAGREAAIRRSSVRASLKGHVRKYEGLVASPSSGSSEPSSCGWGQLCTDLWRHRVEDGCQITTGPDSPNTRARQ